MVPEEQAQQNSDKGTDYEIVPKKQIDYLVQEVERLKRNPMGDTKHSRDLYAIMYALNQNLQKFVGLLNSASDEIVRDYRDETQSHKLNILLKQNEQLGEGVLMIGNLLKELKGHWMPHGESQFASQSAPQSPQQSPPQSPTQSAPQPAPYQQSYGQPSNPQWPSEQPAWSTKDFGEMPPPPPPEPYEQAPRGPPPTQGYGQYAQNPQRRNPFDAFDDSMPPPPPPG